MPKLNVSRFLLLPQLKLIEFSSFKRFVHFHCESDKKRAPCPFCGDPRPRLHQYYKRKLKDGVVRGRLHILIIKMKRYRCGSCHRTFNESLPGILPGKRLTERMQREITWSCENFADLKKVRKHTSCGSKTIYELSLIHI